MRKREFDYLSAIMEDLEETNPSAFPMLFAFKQTDFNQIMDLSQQVAQENIEQRKFPSK